MRKLNYIALIGFMLANYMMNAQRVFVRYTASNNEMLIKWMHSELTVDGGFDVFRSENGGPFEKLNNTPIAPNPNAALSLEEKSIYDVATGQGFEFGSEPISTLLVIQKTVESLDLSLAIGIAFQDNSVNVGSTYQYRVQSASSAEVISTTELVRTTSDYLTNGPTDVVFKEKNKSVSIGWSNESDRYYGVHVYRTNKNTDERVLLTEKPVLYSSNTTLKNGRDYQFVDKTVEKDTEYEYELVAIDYFGLEAGKSETLELGPKDILPPPPAQSIVLDPSEYDMKMSVAWECDIAEDFSHFQVLHKSPGQSEFEIAADSLNADDKYLLLETQKPGLHEIAILSYDQAGNFSSSDTADTKINDVVPPTSPTGVEILVDSGNVTVTWKQNQEPDLAGYVVYGQKSAKGSFFKLNAEPIPTEQFVEVFPAKRVAKLSYKIVAVDTNRNMSPMSEAGSYQISDHNPPPSPQLQKINFNEKAISIEWLTRESNDLNGFNVYRKTNEDTVWRKINLIAISDFATKYTDQNIREGLQYSYAITAYDTAGNESEKSNLKTIKTPSTEGVPSIKSFKTTLQKRTQKVTITWEVENSENVIGYMVYHEDEASGKMIPISGKLTTNSFTHKPQTNGKNSYQLKVFDTKGKKHLSETKTLSIKLSE